MDDILSTNSAIPKAGSRPYVMEIKGISKSFGEMPALHPLSLSVYQGEFLTLLGPSGCGKTTLLRLIAGLEAPDAGEILLEGRRIDQAPAHQRDVHTVFQNYALFPHLTVFENVAFPLSLKKVAKAEIAWRVEEALTAVGLAGFGKRRTHQMSGGQQQRVALARALVARPSMLLLDEPFGALDVQLRKDLQLEMRRIHREFGIAFIHVTHDQEEALTMSERIAVMRAGRIEQIGTPTEIYNNPATAWVASFVGRSNILRGEIVTSPNGATAVRLANGAELACDANGRRHGERVAITIRPENISLRPDSSGLAADAVLKGTVRDVLFAGPLTELVIESNGLEPLLCYLLPTDALMRTGVSIGDNVLLSWDSARQHILAVE